MLSAKKYLKKLINGLVLLGLVLSGPIFMDEAKDIYWVEVASPKASPVAITLNGVRRVVASSSQIKFKGKRYTLTNHHVCRVAARLMPKKVIKRAFIIQKGELYIQTTYKKITDKELIGKKLLIGKRSLKILKLDDEHDLCLMAPDLSKSYFKLASNYHMGERITVIGHPRGLPQTIREGRLVAYREWVAPWLPNKNPIRSVMISALSYGGNSGSPILNRFGNLVGVLFAGQSGIHTEAEIVPLEAVKSFLFTYIGE